jgi:Flp pilus assembly protein TadD
VPTLAKQQKTLGVEAQALVARSSLYEVKRERVKYERDVEEAYRVLPTHPPALANYAVLLHSRGNTDAAITLLRAAVASCPSEEGTFILSNLLRERGSSGDLKEALSHPCSLAVANTHLVDGFRGARCVVCDVYR